MKIFLTGATGNIGSDILDLCLKHPKITTVVAFTRRQLPDDVTANSKLETVVVKDWKNWPEDVLAGHRDAVGMIWYALYIGALSLALRSPNGERRAVVTDKV